MTLVEMANNGCGQLGAIQTRGTCWFYSILNGFILSTDGHAILFNYLNEFYEKLTKDEKAYFDSKNNAPCPLKDLTKVKQIYFWKFIDQYLCLLGGPRSINLKAGRSVELLKNINLAGEKARINQGGKGASGQQEICRVLDHIDFKGKYDTRYAHTQGRFDGRKKPQFVVVRESENKPRDYMLEFPSAFMNDEKYELMCTGITIANQEARNKSMHTSHAISGFVCNGKGFLFDSNQMKTWPCKWWIRSEMIRVIDDDVAPFYSFFKHGQITYYGYMYAIFARKEFTKDIRPSCRLAHKKTKTPNVNLNFANPNFGKVLNTANMGFNPAQVAALKRKWGRTEHRKSEYVSASNVQFIVAISNKRETALKKLATLLKTGLKINPTVVEIFNEKMEAKFPSTRSPPKPRVPSPPKPRVPSPPKARSPSHNKINAIIAKHNKRWKAHTEIMNTFNIDMRKHKTYINNKLNAKWPSPTPSRSPSLNKINAIINRANTRQKALENVSANKTINVVKHRNYYSQKLREKFGSPSARSPSLAVIDAIINEASTHKKAVAGLASSAVDPMKHRNYLTRKLREKFG